MPSTFARLSPRYQVIAIIPVPWNAFHYFIPCRYNPKRFSAAIIRLRDPKTTALIFASGKMVGRLLIRTKLRTAPTQPSCRLSLVPRARKLVCAQRPCLPLTPSHVFFSIQNHHIVFKPPVYFFASGIARR